MFYKAVLWVHVLVMLGALALLGVSEALLLRARRGRLQPAKLALIASTIAERAMTAGVIAGIVLVLAGGWSLTTPWLLASLAIIVGVIALSRRVVGPWQKRLGLAVRTAAAPHRLAALARERAAMLARLGMLAMIGLVAVLMTAKPDFEML